MSGAQIYDRGYRSYDGERAGIGWSMWSLGVDATRRAFGLKRPAKHKVLPIICLLLAFVPALIYVGISAIIPGIESTDILAYEDYYGFIGSAIVLFGAGVAPDVLSTDRRTGMLAMYMASPLDRATYILSKVTAVFAVMLTMTMLPLLFMLVANIIVGSGPDGFGGYIKLILQIVGSGLITGLYFTGVSMAIAATTPKRSIASVGFVGAMLIPQVLVVALIEGGDAPDEVGLLSLLELPFAAARRIFGADFGDFQGIDSVGSGLVIFTTLAVGIGGVIFTWWRYQRIDIPR